MSGWHAKRFKVPGQIDAEAETKRLPQPYLFDGGGGPPDYSPPSATPSVWPHAAGSFCDMTMAPDTVAQSNATPMRFSLRQTMWHGRFNWSDGTNSVKRSGMNKGVTTSSAAPVSEILRTVQSIPPPPNSIVPAFKVRWRGAIRGSSMPSI